MNNRVKKMKMLKKSKKIQKIEMRNKIHLNNRVKKMRKLKNKKIHKIWRNLKEKIILKMVIKIKKK